jgi:NAD(P)-dependent dehydrogenase (short-subunit alcohol dehydrogenase family)
LDSFNGKVAVVTGGAGGIGKAMVHRFAAEGMRVVVADIVPDVVEKTVSELRRAGHDVIGVVTDVTSLESVEALRDATLEAFGAVQVVCNNAGIGSGAEGHFWEHHVNDWRWSLDVNVMGVINGINAFVPTLSPRTRATWSTPPRATEASRPSSTAPSTPPPRRP